MTDRVREGPARVVRNAGLERLRRFTRVLDDGIPVPGTRLRIGLDPILGLVPGVGDIAGAILAGSILAEGIRQGIPRLALLRMVYNIALDSGLGSIPVVGDIFDAVWKANRKNLSVLERHLEGVPAEKPAGRLLVIVLVAVLLLVCVALAAGVALFATWLFGSSAG